MPNCHIPSKWSSSNLMKMQLCTNIVLHIRIILIYFMHEFSKCIQENSIILNILSSLITNKWFNNWSDICKGDFNLGSHSLSMINHMGWHVFDLLLRFTPISFLIISKWPYSHPMDGTSLSDQHWALTTSSKTLSARVMLFKINGYQ